jgi:Cu/Ag efflux protein CusF
MTKLTFPRPSSRQAAPRRRLPAGLAPGERTAQEWADHHRKMVVVLIALGVIGSYPMGVFLMAVLTAPLRPEAPAAPPAARPIRAAGVVLSMNDTTGTITVQHRGVPELNLPAGTTSFRADPGVSRRTLVGDRISFDLAQEGGVYTITASQPSPQP